MTIRSLLRPHAAVGVRYKVLARAARPAPPGHQHTHAQDYTRTGTYFHWNTRACPLHDSVAIPHVLSTCLNVLHQPPTSGCRYTSRRCFLPAPKPIMRIAECRTLVRPNKPGPPDRPRSHGNSMRRTTRARAPTTRPSWATRTTSGAGTMGFWAVAGSRPVARGWVTNPGVTPCGARANACGTPMAAEAGTCSMELHGALRMGAAHVAVAAGACG